MKKVSQKHFEDMTSVSSLAAVALQDTGGTSS